MFRGRTCYIKLELLNPQTIVYNVFHVHIIDSQVRLCIQDGNCNKSTGCLLNPSAFIVSVNFASYNFTWLGFMKHFCHNFDSIQTVNTTSKVYMPAKLAYIYFATSLNEESDIFLFLDHPVVNRPTYYSSTR